MKVYELTQDHQGMAAGTKLTGPTLIPGSADTYGYFPEGVDSESKYCFFESYINNNPTLFTEVKSPQLES